MSEVYSAANAAVRMNVGEGTEATIAGLNSLTLPLGFTRGSVAVEEFGVDIDTKITTGATYDDLAFAGNFIVGDTNGQDLLRSYAIANTSITNIRFYISYAGTPLVDDFVKLNAKDDSDGFFKVNSFQTPAAQKSGIFTLNVGMIVGGRTALFDAHAGGTGLAFVEGAASAADTITSTSSGFVTAGFKASDCLFVEGTSLNDGHYKITSVAAGTLTVSTGSTLTTEGGGASTFIHGGI